MVVILQAFQDQSRSMASCLTLAGNSLLASSPPGGLLLLLPHPKCCEQPATLHLLRCSWALPWQLDSPQLCRLLAAALAASHLRCRQHCCCSPWRPERRLLQGRQWPWPHRCVIDWLAWLPHYAPREAGCYRALLLCMASSARLRVSTRVPVVFGVAVGSVRSRRLLRCI